MMSKQCSHGPCLASPGKNSISQALLSLASCREVLGLRALSRRMRLRFAEGVLEAIQVQRQAGFENLQQLFCLLTCPFSGLRFAFSPPLVAFTEPTCRTAYAPSSTWGASWKRIEMQSVRNPSRNALTKSVSVIWGNGDCGRVSHRWTLFVIPDPFKSHFLCTLSTVTKTLDGSVCC